MVIYLIRPLEAVAEYHTCEALQKAVWQFSDREIIPSNELITIHKNGGVVLGAFSAKGGPSPTCHTAGRSGGNQAERMLGFVFGFPGIRNKQLIHCSRMLAVLPEFRNSDIGYHLKLAQKRAVLKQGINLITWTFDPLQSVNGYFNIEKLGVIIRRYYVNLYGLSSSILNQGLETDRFLAEWWIQDKNPKSNPRLNRGQIPIPDDKFIVNPTYYNKDHWLVCGKPHLSLKNKYLFVEIPPDIMAMKKADIKLARAWRRQTRLIFTRYFDRYYIISRFISEVSDNHRRSFYILNKHV